MRLSASVNSDSLTGTTIVKWRPTGQRCSLSKTGLEQEGVTAAQGQGTHGGNERRDGRASRERDRSHGDAMW